MASVKKRTERLRKERPGHLCAKCTAVVYDDELRCEDCDEPRPEEGWPSLDDGFDSFLGRVLGGRYLISKYLGSGASSTVYRAQAIDTFRRFAIKVVQLESDEESWERPVRGRFEREIDALSRLRNPHIAQVYEVIDLPRGLFAVVMDFCDGVTVEQMVLEQGALSVGETFDITRQIANGLHEAHEVGMIHRDLKPQNVMVDRLPNGDLFAHILDFGIVQTPDGAKLTHGYVGTPLYSSPEQAVGGSIDRRSDIYSLGAVVFFMLTQRPPFLSRSTYEVLLNHVRTAPPTLSAASGRMFPQRLEQLVARMLAKDPDQRPSDLSQVLAELVELRRGIESNTDPMLAIDPYAQTLSPGDVVPTVSDDFDLKTPKGGIVGVLPDDVPPVRSSTPQDLMAAPRSAVLKKAALGKRAKKDHGAEDDA